MSTPCREFDIRIPFFTVPLLFVLVKVPYTLLINFLKMYMYLNIIHNLLLNHITETYTKLLIVCDREREGVRVGG